MDDNIIREWNLFYLAVGDLQKIVTLTNTGLTHCETQAAKRAKLERYLPQLQKALADLSDVDSSFRKEERIHA